MKQGDTLSQPKGWEIKKLGEVCELSAGGDVPKDNFSETKTEKYSIPIYANGEKNEGLYGYTNIVKVSKPSITVSARGTIGFSVKRLEAFFPVVRLIVVTPKNLKDLELDFLDYALKRIDFKHSGSSIPQLTVPMIRDYEIPLPPLPEQQRIVSILDEAFAAIAKTKANAEQNLKNAKELFESYLQGVFEKKGDGWEEKTLGEVCSLITDGKHGDCENEENSGYYFLSAKDVRNGTLLFENARQITKSGFEETHRRTNLQPGDICMVNTGATIGRISFAPDDPRTYKTTFQKSVAVIKTIPTLIDNNFCCYILQSDLKKLVKVSSGTAVPNLLLGDLKRHKINLPKSKEEQQTIVRQLDALRAETQKLEAVYQKKIADLEELKKSILQKAFSGELKN